VQDNLRWGGLVDASTGLVTAVTRFGLTSGLTVSAPLPDAKDQIGGLYVVVEVGGSNIGQTPGVQYDEGDWCLCIDQANGWIRIDTLSSGGGGGSQFLADLLDVNLTNPLNNQVLTFNSTLSKWENKTASALAPVQTVFGRTGTVVATEGDYSLDLLGDVTLSSPTDQQVLQYNAGTGKWQNATAAAGGITTINGTAPIQVTGVGDTRTVAVALSTTTATGVVQLADANAVSAGTAGRVVTAPQLKTTNDNLTTTNSNVTSLQGSVSTLQTDVTNLQSDVALKAYLDSPSFTGTPLAPTPGGGDNSTRIATTAFVAGSLGGYALLNSSQTFSGGQRGAYSIVGDTTNISLNFNATNNFYVTLGGNRLLDTPIFVNEGQSGVIRVIQDGVGGRTLSFASIWKFPDGTPPSLTTTPGAVDLLVYHVETSNRIAVRFVGDVK